MVTYILSMHLSDEWNYNSATWVSHFKLLIIFFGGALTLKYLQSFNYLNVCSHHVNIHKNMIAFYLYKIRSTYTGLFSMTFVLAIFSHQIHPRLSVCCSSHNIIIVFQSILISTCSFWKAETKLWAKKKMPWSQPAMINYNL